MKIKTLQRMAGWMAVLLLTLTPGLQAQEPAARPAKVPVLGTYQETAR